MIKILKKRITNNKFNYLVTIAIIIFVILPLIIKNIFFEKFFLNLMNKENYYNSLYGTSSIGCSTLNYIKPDILFIGDSMGYRAWDLNMIQKSTNLSVGACYLPSFTHESLEELLKFVEKKFTPKFIVLSNNYRIFGFGSGNIDSVKRHKKFLKEIDQSQYQQAFKLFFKKIRGKNFYEISLPIDKEIQNYIDITSDEKFDKFTNLIIDRNLKTSGIGTFKEARIELTEHVQIIKEFKNINFFCNYLNNNNINLIFTNLPYSPPLYKIKLNKYFENNKLVKNYFQKCIGKKFFYTNNNDFISKNKYFVFTNFLNYDLSLFKKIQENKATINSALGYYDYDHMNRYGARKFTKYWLKQNKRIFKSENK